MPGPVEDPRADALRERFHEVYGGADLPVPVEAIAEDLLGLTVADDADLWCSGMLLPAKREILLNAREGHEAPGRRRFTLTHELGHWVCQVLEGHVVPAYCRTDDVRVDAGRQLEREANVFAAELLMPRQLVRKTHAASGRSGEVARSFGVSEEAMGWRLYNLGLEGRPEDSVP